MRHIDLAAARERIIYVPTGNDVARHPHVICVVSCCCLFVTSVFARDMESNNIRHETVMARYCEGYVRGSLLSDSLDRRGCIRCYYIMNSSTGVSGA